MQLIDRVKKFCNSEGIDIFLNTSLTRELVFSGWQKLADINIQREKYSASLCLTVGNLDTPVIKWPVSATKSYSGLFIEYPQHEDVLDFLSKQNLMPAVINEVNLNKISQSLVNALEIIKLVPAMGEDVSELVKSIVVLQSNDPDIDIGYSHPSVPFSIFVTTCESSDQIARLRVAESIVHEAMHLKLSLIESVCSLVDVSKFDTYYSPWRSEQRPVQGVLHGIFVFRILLEFYKSLAIKNNFNSDTKEYIHYRMEDIFYEILSVKYFQASEALSLSGKRLAATLLDAKLL